MEKTEPYSRK